ncbi:4-hydroxyphenylpyruvate dioxygenase [Nocardia aurantia]|uniref:4-hydroxymandelate synthase n=1 Tax=Nocardia aurantia TaxID=2585199 RepID=A0A7K0DRL1_9NOCA|nr:4-hydroxyphenylpyruvate dioxygenase [Nocardia aurantia]MQY28022.1 4-hydroxymandelate synthase [Nocardia aurantia]
MQVLREARLDHVEFYVGDVDTAAKEFVTKYGFAIAGRTGSGIHSHRSIALRQGGIVLLLTQGLTYSSPISTWVRKHGDGVATIWLRTPAVRAAFAEAVANGAVATLKPAERAGVVTAAFGAFGDIRHGLVQRRDDDAPGQLPPDIVPLDRAPAAESATFRTLDHFAYLVGAGELRNAVKFYESVLGFSVIFEDRTMVGGQGMDSQVVQNPAGDVTFTIVESAAEPGQALDFIAEFVRNNGGPGIEHIAFACPDIVTAVGELRQAGVEFLGAPGAYYDMLPGRLGDLDRHPLDELRGGGILADRDHGGELFQIFTRSTHARNTFFLEVIERVGAKTFGKSNVQALFEARKAERDQRERL